MTDRELMQMALDALEMLAKYENPLTKLQVRKPRDGGPIVTLYPHKVATEAAVPLRARLAQPEQEPVAWKYETPAYVSLQWKQRGDWRDGTWTALYTTPPQRPWQGLTDEERQECLKQGIDYGWIGIADAVETKLKEKNK